MRPLPGLVLMLAGLGACATASAQVRQSGAVLEGRGGVLALASGDGHSCAIRRDGTVACWGANYAGQATPPEGRFTQLAAGMMHTCGLRDDGRLECWGNIQLQWQDEWTRYATISSNGSYVCGIRMDGHVECLGWTPDNIQTPELLSAFAAGETHACALAGNGNVRCWGDIGFGGPPPTLPGPEDRFKAIASGYRASCGLRADGTVSCWGEPLEGVPPTQGARYSAITMGRRHACGLRLDGTADCWGDSRGVPPPATDRFVALAAGAYHTCGLRSDGRLSCWGEEFQGATLPPDGVFGLGSLDAGFGYTCQTRPDGAASCWGRDGSGQTQPPQAMPWETPWRFTEIGTAFVHSCGRRDDGTTVCWGEQGGGRTLPPPGLLRMPALGYHHACALGDDGTARCWGEDTNGQATPPADVLRSLTAGLVHTCGVRDDGTATCWGYGGDDQLIPPPPTGEWDLRIASMQAHDRGNCALFTNNHASCRDLSWGGMIEAMDEVRAYSVGQSSVCWIDEHNELRCQGSGSLAYITPPAGRFVSVATGSGSACAIRSDGARVCWGDGEGTEYPILRLEPRDLPPLSIGQPVDFPVELQRSTPDYGSQAVPATIAVAEGTLPPGIVLENGRLQGTATQGGQYTVTLEGRDADGFVASSTMTLRVDDTPPVVTAQVDGPMGDNGWYVGDVSIAWSVSDDESWSSGESGCEPTVLASDSPAAGFSCTGTSAGGSVTQTVTIKRDATPPQTVIGEGPLPQTSQTTAEFDFGADEALSGVARFECSLDDAPFANCTSRLTLESLGTGPHVFAVRAVDHAGNTDPTPALHYWRVDASAPQITSSIEGELGANGWYIGDVTVRWAVQDPDSPLQAMTGCDPVTLRADTPGATFTCTARSAGGSASATVSVKRDATAPVVVAAPQAAPNANGWHRTDVVVGFACSDALSGVVACPVAQTRTAEGESTVAPVMVVDQAGNRAMSAPVTVRIDRTAPVLAPAAPASLLLNAAAAASANAIDVVSGVSTQSCSAVVTSSVGTRQVNCTATDRAGNTASGSATYRVNYGFNGFTSPVHNPPVLNVLKAGRSVPLRWRVVDANGAPVTNLTSAGVAAVAIACPAAGENRITLYGGNSAALQNLGNGYYQLDWMAATSLRNLCRRLELDLGDGVPRATQFKFN
ncbi:PxKF domain-containing protein [Agrilutibacter solisilvae]|uniref:non-specific serine/threonine protein kinase n=1 Tax=Agrilutibacter solisilvae TaxID=2763317 RepID=A0A974Y0U7_9GAMM|nr:PxKF domain-containing protein [Lysobacter solisilvae]QSX79244.1 PxKF domain-containing protein [Lysobacter solisilvae]